MAGIKVEIVIECDEANEIVQHLSVLKSQFIKEIKKKNSGMDLPERLNSLVIEDSNCYGEHKATIKWD